MKPFLKPVKAVQLTEHNIQDVKKAIPEEWRFSTWIHKNRTALDIDYTSTYGDDDYTMTAQIGDWIVIDEISQDVEVFNNDDFISLFREV